jgi:hypothetical protein
VQAAKVAERHAVGVYRSRLKTYRWRLPATTRACILPLALIGYRWRLKCKESTMGYETTFR